MEFERLGDDERKLRELLRLRSLRRLKISNPICLTSVDSTQSFIANKLHSSAEGDLVISRVQTAGKGREGRSWFSQEGGLWMTMTLLPPNADILARIPSIATNSILKTLEDFGARGCSIKPPNDVYCGGRKIAGVLADASVTGSSSVVYLGVGINVNNDTSEIDRISETATSMRYETGSTLDLMEFAASLIASLDFEYARAIAEM